jgi:signal transduction histidine kinase
MLRPFFSWRAASTGVVLAATLVTSLVLGYEAVRAARSQRQTVEKVLQDYASLAAWQFERGIAAALSDRLRPRLVAIHETLDREPHTHPSGKGAETLRAAVPGGAVLTGSASRALVWMDGRVRAGVAVQRAAAVGRFEWLVHHAALRPRADSAAVALTDDGRLLAWHVAMHHGQEIAIGLVLEREDVAQMFDELTRKAALLPPALTRGRDNAQLVYIEVSDTHGRLFAIGAAASPFATDGQLPPEAGGLRYRLAIAPGAADTLIIGGVPRDRLPLVAGLLLLTLALAIGAIVQWRREQELVQMRSDFVAGVSHELRTPLAQIRMFAESLLLERVRAPEDRTRALEIIARECARLTHIVDNVMQFAARSSGARHAASRMLLAPVVQQTLDAFAPLAAARQTIVSAQLDETAEANVEPDAFRQVLLNLLDNAVKYGPPGQSVRVELMRTSEGAALVVEDQGPGIPSEHHAEVWEAFRRLPSAVAAGTGGSGIGLAIVRRIVEAHEGRARIESQGAGARVIVELPCRTS